MAKKRKKSGAASQAADTRAKRGATAKAQPSALVRYGPWAIILAVVAGALLWQSGSSSSGHGRVGQVVPEELAARVIARHPHDREAFTQGLVWHDGKLFESTGLYGESTLREVDLESGRVLRQVEIDEEHFAEGLALVRDELLQLTWRSGKAFVFGVESFDRVREHDYDGEGWGLCFDGTRLVMSSGSDRLQLRDPRTFEKTGELRVTKAGRRLRQLNELECVGGDVYANVWTNDHIARIDGETGEVTGWIDAGGLLTNEDRQGGEDVLNGIAWMPETEHFLLTGKRWPYVYEVVFEPKERRPRS